MSHQSQTERCIHFVGDATLDWENNTTTGDRTWKYRYPIEEGKIDIGTEIAILRYHPLHQDSLDSHLGNRTTRPQAVLLRGKILGIRTVKKSIVTFTTKDTTNGTLTAVNIPIAATPIDPDGGWYMKVIPIWSRKGLILRYYTWFPACDL